MNELYSTNDLQQRYKIAKQTLSDRINDLGIKRPKRGFITGEQVKILDKLHDHIGYGGTVNDFLIQSSGVTNNNGTSLSSIATIPQVVVNIDQINEIIQLLKEPSPLQKFRDLSELATQGFIVPTSLLKSMGISPRTKKGDDKFIWGSFKFEKSTKIGRENGWIIKKLVN